MTEAQRAHLRVLESRSLPIRTVQEREGRGERTGVPGNRPLTKDTLTLHNQIVRLHQQGVTRREMVERLGVSLPTIGKHLNGKIKAAGNERVCPPAPIGRPAKP